MSTMYSRSIAMLEQSVNALHKVGEDDAFLDVACFEAQQAIEFLLKAVLLDNGIAYDKSHISCKSYVCHIVFDLMQVYNSFEVF